MRVYISGPISGYDLTERKIAFSRAVTKLNEDGHYCINPLEVKPCADMSCDSGQFARRQLGVHAWTCYMRHDIVAMMQCDAIAMLPGWMESKGAMIEYNLALELGFTVIYLNENGDIRDVA